jgi:hypothetical protein
MASTETYNSISGGDGWVGAGATTYAAVNAATTGTANTTDSSQVFCQNDRVSGSDFQIKRYFFPFDTSSLPDNCTITAATFSWYFTKDSAPTAFNPNSDAVSLIQTSQASSTSLTGNDFDNVGTTKGASDVNFADIPNSAAYVDMALNATGLTWISKTGVTYLGLRSKNDIANSAPTGRSFLDSGVFANSATNKPKLVITYTIPDGPTNLKSYNTNLKENIKSINTNLIANVKTLNTNA